MKKFLFILTLPFILLSSGFSALSPLQQSIKELNTMLLSKELSHALQENEAIHSIKREGSSFLIETEDKQIQVDITYLPTKRIGPAEFRLIFHPPKKL